MEVDRVKMDKKEEQRRADEAADRINQASAASSGGIPRARERSPSVATREPSSEPGKDAALRRPPPPDADATPRGARSAGPEPGSAGPLLN